ncbi:uncharacterized protein CANTADRAFT_89961 [Suhomyces tanzawaensis NRRL Y-17324]|uniref:Uncharacterized protein n=1 Tax=Suhomyces tanzawaensis NRRL Y-17324 TaxID=984487 RepID=A0A1E4SLL1_9ASCO|nr:uncharacterized protein CANTADRAFT_89961 [Suhomyces tanzawaensis NRRL Y-17324]ODV80413.1 hypothetical protein CANTADRAFT_89961 [Suhomyces tanzawaensis NRRL Y-17324]
MRPEVPELTKNSLYVHRLAILILGFVNHVDNPIDRKLDLEDQIIHYSRNGMLWP